jgi:hypothetical protein
MLNGVGGGRGGFTGLACNSCQSVDHISDQTHKFQNKTGLDAKANSELYKSNQLNSVYIVIEGVKSNFRKHIVYF